MDNITGEREQNPDYLYVEDLETITIGTDSTPYPGDPDATWIYWTQIDTEKNGVPVEYVWERLRNRRDILLTNTDYRMVTDAPWDTQNWANYRQALRDLPDNTSDPRLAQWPEAPNE